MTVLYHKRRTVHSIFQVRISRYTQCVDKTGFPRPGHLYSFWGVVGLRTRVVRGDFVTLVVGSQEPSGEWVKNKRPTSTKTSYSGFCLPHPFLLKFGNDREVCEFFLIYLMVLLMFHQLV